MEGSTPAPLPVEWKNFYGDGFVFTEQSWSAPSPSGGAYGICFENPAGWEAVLKDMKSKCARGKLEFLGVLNKANNAPECKHSAGWSYHANIVFLYETTASTFVLEVVHNDFKMPK